jgi:hypothetical protein
MTCLLEVLINSVVDAKYGSSWAGWCSLDPHESHGGGYGRTLGRGGVCLVAIPDLFWVMVLMDP